MKKDFGVHPFLFPMPTYMVVTYNEDESVDAMAMAWGGICAENMVALNLEEDHKTVANLKARGAFHFPSPAETLLQNPILWVSPVPTRFRKSFPSPACMQKRAPVWMPPLSWIIP